jgi:hypothetical protein
LGKYGSQKCLLNIYFVTNRRGRPQIKEYVHGNLIWVKATFSWWEDNIKMDLKKYI